MNLKKYGSKLNRGYRYVFVVIDSFSKLGWTVPLKNKNAPTIKNSSEIVLITSKRSPNLVETQRGKELLNKVFTDFLIKNNIKRYPRNFYSGAVFAEGLNRTVQGLLNLPVF